jgi:hypothetical protein
MALALPRRPRITREGGLQLSLTRGMGPLGGVFSHGDGTSGLSHFLRFRGL